MSVKVMSWVFDYSESTGNSRLVLLAIADHADDERWSCWPSVARLAVKARVSERTVQRSIRELVDIGELSILEGGGSRKTHRFTVCPQGCQVVTSPGGSGVTGHASEVTDRASRGDTRVTRTISNHQRTAPLPENDPLDGTAVAFAEQSARHARRLAEEDQIPVDPDRLAKLRAIKAQRHQGRAS